MSDWKRKKSLQLKKISEVKKKKKKKKKQVKLKSQAICGLSLFFIGSRNYEIKLSTKMESKERGTGCLRESELVWQMPPISETTCSKPVFLFWILSASPLTPNQPQKHFALALPALQRTHKALKRLLSGHWVDRIQEPPQNNLRSGFAKWKVEMNS